ncbi:MAG: hypothetical protein AAGA48_22250 [Myxococcota bacterium]
MPGVHLGDLDDDGYDDFFVRDSGDLVITHGAPGNAFTQGTLTYPETTTQVVGLADMDGDTLGGYSSQNE